MPSVLIVDDHLDQCLPLQTLLRLIGHRAACVNSGRAALDYIRSHPTSLMLLDVMMPEMSGIDVLRAIRADHQFDSLPILMYSALSDQARIAEARQLGAQDYLVKGNIRFDDLRALIERHIGPPG